MAVIPPQVKADLSLIYELPQFKSVVKYCRIKRLEAAERLLNIDMSVPGSDKVIAGLQGQSFIFQFLEADWRRIHKEQMAKIDQPKSKKRKS